jgi:hypothetical protein
MVPSDIHLDFGSPVQVGLASARAGVADAIAMAAISFSVMNNVLC